MIEVKDLVKKYGNKTALDRISFSVGNNGVIGFLGPNGAGKTTTMNILTGYLSASSGTVKIGGHDILDEPDAVKKMVGYLPELPPLYLDMTVREYLQFMFRLKKSTLPMKPHLKEIAEITRIDGVYNRIISNLSKGYRQRVGIAQALIGDPKVLILDEPTVGLDPAQVVEMRELVREYGRSHIVILSSHILSEVQEICERVIIISHGRIVADGELDVIRAAYGRKELTRLVLDKADCDADLLLRAIDGIELKESHVLKNTDKREYLFESPDDDVIRKQIFDTVVGAGYSIYEMSSAQKTLEEIFIQLTKDKAEETEYAGDSR